MVQLLLLWTMIKTIVETPNSGVSTGTYDNLMTATNIPPKCKDCSKLDSFRYHKKCDICQRIELEEELFCDLNRSVQDEDSFKCSAFEPRFTVVNSETKPEVSSDQQIKERIKDQYLNLFNSDRIKYQRALALQKLKRDPDTVFMQLKYHFAWNVRNRKPAFKSDQNIVEAVYKLFDESCQVVNDFVSLISLAPDHVHVLVETNGELSVEELVNRIKEFTNKGLNRECLKLKESFENDSIWDDAYFAETMG